MSQPQRYMVTSALPYANGPIHIGHLAGVYVPSDIYVRYLRLRGRDVLWVCGSDEHGVPIALKARQEGCSPQEVVDRYHELILKSFQDFGIQFDHYSRTSRPIHHQTASDFFLRLHHDGQFVEQSQQQYFDPEAGQFLADRLIKGTCPHCSNTQAYGDQCEKCGTTLDPTDLIDPKSSISGATPILKETRHWFLPLDRHEGFFRQWILEQNKDRWRANVLGQCKSWIEQGLKPRAVTRDQDWGVKVPLPEAQGKVLYVWFDAPIGYISATKEFTPDWEKYWTDPGTKLVHFIGKDNIVFHCIIFPAMLRAHGGFILPDNVPANEFLNLEGDKISTSRNWAVWLHGYLQDFPEDTHKDALRYALTASAPETKDNDFSWREFQARNNNELVANLGNFVNRAMILTHKYFDGKVPAAELGQAEREVLDQIPELRAQVEANLEAYRFRDAQFQMMNLARLGSKFLAESEPWKLAKTDMARVAAILNTCLQVMANLAILAEPFLPFGTAKLRQMLNWQPQDWEQAGAQELLPAGRPLGQAELLYTKIEDDKVQAQLDKLQRAKQANLLAQVQAPPAKEPVPFEDFAKLDLRVGTILEAARVPKAKKLLRLTIDTGLDKRTVVSGIAEHFEPESLPGQKVCLLLNLPPRPIRGIVSEGMILTAENPDGSLSLVQPGPTAATGALVK